MQPLKEKILLYNIITKRDTESYGQLYDLYIERIYRFVYFKVQTKEDAEDVTSEVFLKAWQYIIEKSPTAIESVSGLLFSIARNSIIDWYRQKAKKPVVSLEVITEMASEKNEQEALASLQEVEQMLELMKKLKQDYQEVLILKYIEGLKMSEIAKVLGKSGVSVRVLLHRATKKLKDLSEIQETSRLEKQKAHKS